MKRSSSSEVGSSHAKITSLSAPSMLGVVAASVTLHSLLLVAAFAVTHPFPKLFPPAVRFVLAPLESFVYVCLTAPGSCEYFTVLQRGLGTSKCVYGCCRYFVVYNDVSRSSQCSSSSLRSLVW